jgi:aminopeptidase N
MINGDGTSDHRAFALPGARANYGPDRIVEVERIALDLHPDFDAETLEGTCATTVRALDEPVERVSLNAVDLEIDSVERDGASQGFERRDGTLDIEFSPPLAAGERTTFSIRYRAVRPRHGLFFIKPTPAHPEKRVHLWTQSQDENARYWFPCIDRPSEKQPTETRITVSSGIFALGNGALVEKREGDGQTTFEYRQDVPHSTYLMTIVAGPFVEVDQGTAGANRTPVYYYVLPGREADGERSFANTPRMIETFEQRTGRAYPYARYSQIAVTDFIFGGMENTSATTQTDRTLHDAIAHLDFSSDPLVSHELAHQWFGDLLTCRDWAHAWLNEGFATFFEAVWREEDKGYDEYQYDVFEFVAAYLEEDAHRYRRPIVYNTFRDPIEIFDRHLYQKGGAVLHMLRGNLGDARFWRSIQRYVDRNAERNVETIDLIRAIEEATGRNMRAFFDQWVFRGGHPELEVALAWDDEHRIATVTIDQKQKVDESNPAYRFDVELGFVTGKPAIARDAGPCPVESERRLRVSVERAHETITVPLESEPTLVRFDPGAFILADVTYKFGVRAAAAVLLADPSVVSRIRAARELARDGSAMAVGALRQAFSSEPFWGVLVQVASAIGATRAPWAHDILMRALAHKDPKVRRAVAAALGNFREADVASGLLDSGMSDASYFVRAAALESAGKTRDPRAFDVLISASRERTWNGTVEAGAVRGLAELADARALAPILSATAPQGDEGVRRAAAAALARLGELVESTRRAVVDALEQLFDDPAYLVQLAAVAAAETLGDSRLLSTLDRISSSATDARTRRDAMEAIVRIRENAKVPSQVTALRSDIDGLREEQRKLQEKIEALARPSA